MKLPISILLLSLHIQAVRGAELDSVLIEKLQSESASGDPTALFELGKAYASGNGVVRDERKAFDCYRKSAELGNAKAQNNLGRIYFNGWGVEKDEGEAIRWFRRSAEQGASLAQYTLGCMLADGKGAPKDIAGAVHWFKKSADQGYADAQFRLGHLYETGAEGLPANAHEASKWFAKAATQNHPGAANNLGVMHEYGNAVELSKTEAFRLYQLAAAGGDAKGMSNLGRCYAMAIGVTKNPLEAYRWLKRASNRNEVTATNLLVDYKTGLSKEQIAQGEKLAADDEARK
jgi:TPR repeat protein